MAPQSSPIIRHVSRRELTQNRFVWLATGGMYTLFAAMTCGIVMVQSGLSVHRLQVMTAFVVIAAIVHLRSEPPAMDTWRNHLVVASAWIASAVGFWAFQPGGSLAIGASLFVGPLASVRLENRRQIAAHMLGFTVLSAVVAFVGQVDQATAISVVLLLMASPVLAFCCMIILEAAEAQGDELERLVRRDPLTGVGNRRLLDERLLDEIVRHERTQRPLSLIALDLNGFKVLNDTFGHSAGDELLRDVADALTSVTEPGEVVVRQGGDEFCLVLPETSAVHAQRTANAIRARLAKVEAYGASVTTGIGIATFPDDALRGDVLLHVADERLRESKGPRAEPGRWVAPVDGERRAGDRRAGDADAAADATGDGAGSAKRVG